MVQKLKTRSQVAEEYNIHRTTLYRKLKNMGIYLPPGLLNEKWQLLIAHVLNVNNQEFIYKSNLLLEDEDTQNKSR